MTSGLLASSEPTASGEASSLGSPDPGQSFLPLPKPLVGRQRLVHRLVLALILAFGLAKGGYWAVTTQVWNPVDEAQHVGYVESIATGHGIPTVGKDLLSHDIIASVKASPTSEYRSQTFRPDNTDARWSSTRAQYEAVHGPTYYALMAGPYWIGHPWGITGSLLAIRLGTVLLVLSAVPLTWLLARRLFPRRPAAWLLAPALLVTLSGLSFGSVTNDALVLTLGAASTVAVLRSLSRPRALGTLGAGALLGLTLVTKTSAAGLIPFLALAFVAWLVVARPGWRPSLTWLAWFGLGGALTVIPWLAWNEVTYHAISASKAVDALTGSQQPGVPLTWAGIQTHTVVARWGLWVSQLATDGAYRVLWERVLVLSIVAGLIAAAVRRSWRELAAVAWCATALPFSFIALEVLVFVFFGGRGGPTGRYFYGAMAPTMVMIAAAAVLVFGRYWGPVVLTALITWSLVLESRLIDNIVARTYLVTSIDHRLAPAVSQTWSDELVAARPIEADPGCAVEVVDLATSAPPPPTITVADRVGSQTAILVPGPTGLARYRLDRPTDGPFTIRTPPGTELNTSTTERAPEVSFVGASGDPVVRLYCAVGRAHQADVTSFDELFRPQHVALTLDAVHRFPEALVGLAGATTAGLFGWATGGTIGDLRRRRTDPTTTIVTPASP